MSIDLEKGSNVSLSKTVPGLKNIFAGLGWDVRKTEGAAFDLDASLFMLTSEGKVKSDKGFIYFKNLKSEDGSIEHTGDNLTGVGDGDDEVIKIDLTKVPDDIVKLVVVVCIYQAEARKQNFGQVEKATMRVVNAENNEEIAKYDLSEDASVETAMILGEIYRKDAEWKFKAVGQGSKSSVGDIARGYGVNV